MGFSGTTSRQRIGSPLTGHTNQVLCVSFSPDGKLLASGGMDGSVILWNVLSQEPFGQPIRFYGADDRSDQHWIMTVGFSPGGRLLAVGSRDGRVYVLDVATRQLAKAPLEGHAGEVTKVSFSPDGSLLASSSFDDTVIIWDLATGHASGAPLVGDKSRAPLYDVVFSPEGQRVATSSMNGNIALWDLATRQRIGAPFRDVGTTVAFSPDGSTLAAGGGRRVYFVPLSDAVHADGAEASGDSDRADRTTREQTEADADGSSEENGIFLLDVDAHSWMARACRMANRYLTLEEWRQYLGNAPYDPACRPH
jgi:WD40 repeat protein